MIATGTQIVMREPAKTDMEKVGCLYIPQTKSPRVAFGVVVSAGPEIDNENIREGAHIVADAIMCIPFRIGGEDYLTCPYSHVFAVISKHELDQAKKVETKPEIGKPGLIIPRVQGLN